MSLENMRPIGFKRYIVWTQAGFKKAIRELRQSEGDDCLVEGFPKQYPCLVSFTPGYRGYHYWLANCTPLSRAIEQARNTLQALEQADAEHRSAL